MINFSDIVSPDGQDPARWRVRIDGHVGSGVVCDVLFVDGRCDEPVRDTQARKLLAAVGNGVVVEPWDASRTACIADFLPAALVGRLRDTMARYPGERAQQLFGDFFSERPVPAEMLPTAEEIVGLVAGITEHLDAAEAAEAADAASAPEKPAPGEPTSEEEAARLARIGEKIDAEVARHKADLAATPTPDPVPAKKPRR